MLADDYVDEEEKEDTADSLNKDQLLIEAITNGNSEGALAQITLGANPDQFTSFVVKPAIDESYIQTSMLGDFVTRHKVKGNFTKAQTIDCYVLDIIAWFGNYDLVQQIGLDNVDLSIYAISDVRSVNIANPKINRKQYKTSDKKGKKEFNKSVLQRMMWCSIFCSFLARNGNIDGLHTLANFGGQTAKIANMYVYALQNPGGSRFWMDWQNFMDRINLDLAIQASHLCLVEPLELDVLNMLPKPDAVAQDLSKTLESYYSKKQYLSGFCLYMVPLSLFVFISTVSGYLKEDSKAETYIAALMSSIFVVFAAIDALKLTAVLASTAVSCGKIESLGSPRLNAFRLYTMRSVAELTSPATPNINLGIEMKKLKC